VTLAVDRGRVLAEVTEHTPARWTVRAGPYEVRVTGTIFSCDWDAVDSSLEVEVERGEVRVVGPGLEDDGTRLAAGQLLRMAGKTRMPPHVAAAPDERRTGDGRGPEETRAEKPPVQEQPPAAAEAPVAHEVEPPRVRPTEPQPGRPDWRALVAAGKYADAMTAAVAEGFDPLVETLGEDDLWALAGAARYARDGRRTVSALETFRRRFAGSSRAGTAAFLLGRTEAELNASPSRAALWFGSYLLDHGSGPLAEEALGRLIDAQLKAGNPAAACEAARSYLEKYPDGVYRELATSALER
jgi:TolA-binding protein